LLSKKQSEAPFKRATECELNFFFSNNTQYYFVAINRNLIHFAHHKASAKFE